MAALALTVAAVDPAVWAILGTAIPTFGTVVLWVLSLKERRRSHHLAEVATADSSRSIESELLSERAERLLAIIETQAGELERERRYRREDGERFAKRLEDLERIADRERLDKHGFKARVMVEEHRANEAERALHTERLERQRIEARLIEFGLLDRPKAQELDDDR